MKVKNNRCDWCGTDSLYVKYHDEEWGVPVHNDREHFEFLTLESAQAGLSWITVLRKRENYRCAYDNFDPVKIADYGDDKIIELLNNPGIIRNRLKIASSISNARFFLKIQEEFGSFDEFFWSFVNFKPIVSAFENLSDIPSKTDISDKISASLNKRGFKFTGSTIVYAHMQAAGLVNDHLKSCFRYKEINDHLFK